MIIKGEFSTKLCKNSPCKTIGLEDLNDGFKFFSLQVLKILKIRREDIKSDVVSFK